MSGRFDGSQSTIGNTRKYTPAHDCHKRLLENALCFGKSSDGRSPGWLSATPICARSSSTLNPLSCRRCYCCQIGSHAAVRLDGEHRRERGRTASPNVRATQATFRGRA